MFWSVPKSRAAVEPNLSLSQNKPISSCVNQVMVFKLYSVNTPLHHITSWNLEVLELCNEELNIYQKLPNYYSVNNNFFPDETLTDCPFFFAHFWNQGTYKTLQHVSTRMTCCNVLYVPRFQKRVKKMGNRSEFDSERNYYLQN